MTPQMCLSALHHPNIASNISPLEPHDFVVRNLVPRGADSHSALAISKHEGFGLKAESRQTVIRNNHVASTCSAQQNTGQLHLPEITHFLFRLRVLQIHFPDHWSHKLVSNPLL